jgi:elongation factor G
VCFAGHRGCGKTTLAEAVLHAGRVVREPGSVEDGTALLDFGPDSVARRQTLELSSAWFEWARRDAETPAIVQIVDTPGASFLSEVRDLGIRAAEAVVLVIDGTAGVQVGTEEAVRTARAADLPLIAVVSKLDRWSASRADRDRTVVSVADALSALTGARAVVLQAPFHDASGALVGLVDLVEGIALRFADDGSGAFSPEPIPDALAAEVAALREQVAEAIAVTDDRLLEEYLEYLTLPVATLRTALAAAIARRQIVPVLLASGKGSEAQRGGGIGARQLVDAIVAWTPTYDNHYIEMIELDGTRTRLDPGGPFVAQVLSEHRDDKGEPWHLLRVLAGVPPKGDWRDGRSGTAFRLRKTYRMRGPRRATAPSLVPGALVATWDPLPVPAGTTLTDGTRWEVALPEPRPAMMALWVRAYGRTGEATDHDEAQLREALQAVIRADRGLSLRSDASSGARLLAGQDEAHLQVAIERLRAWSGGLTLASELPPVGYVETPSAHVHGVEGLHVHKDGEGLVEEFGRCEVALAPTSPDEGTAFVDAIGDEEDDLPRRYRFAIDQGARDAMRHGPTAGYPVVGVELRLTGGQYDILQSTDDHFRQAGEKAARIALERAGTKLLEPWWKVEVTVPNATVGDLIADIASHRGRILGMHVHGDTVVLAAECPYRELRTFSSRLRSLSGGRGVFETEMSHYEPLPDHLLHEAIAASPHRRDLGHDLVGSAALGLRAGRSRRVAGR